MDIDEPKKPTGRPPANITTEKVEQLAELGCTNVEIASHLSVDERTITRYFQKPEFRMAKSRGMARANVSLRRKQLELALKGDRAMLIWLGKQRLGQRERIEKDEQDGDGLPPLKINAQFIGKKPSD
jgi:site-specific recombinase XerC